MRLFQFLYLPVDPHNGGLVFLELLCPAFNLVIDALQDHVIALFDWFITLTLDPKQVDITDYNECAKLIRLFTKKLQRNGNKWLIVPELHEDGKSYHFHGLVQGDLDLTHWKGEVYNLNNFEFGYTTAMKIKDPQRVATYIAK